jgi:hypothetical protein
VAFQRKKPAVIGIKAPYPGFIEPALATEIDRVPTGSRWIHEIKFDGYRVQVHLAKPMMKTRPEMFWSIVGAAVGAIVGFFVGGVGIAAGGSARGV